MRDIQVLIALATALIMALGTYFSYKSFSKGAAAISKYIFLFFLIRVAYAVLAFGCYVNVRDSARQ